MNNKPYNVIINGNLILCFLRIIFAYLNDLLYKTIKYKKTRQANNGKPGLLSVNT